MVTVRLAHFDLILLTAPAHVRILYKTWQISRHWASFVAVSLEQSLLDFNDQMSVYTTQPWSDNGHGYKETEQFALRDSSTTAAVVRGQGMRQTNAVESRRNPEREMEAHAHGVVHAHFEGSRYVLHLI